MFIVNTCYSEVYGYICLSFYYKHFYSIDNSELHSLIESGPILIDFTVFSPVIPLFGGYSAKTVLFNIPIY